MQIPTDKIRDLIGPGGKMIRSIVEQTGVKIDVEDSGMVNVASSDQASAAKALQIIGDITATAEVGKTYLGKVTRLADFGAFVEIIPGTDGLLHISEVAEHRIADVRDELKEGDQVLVKVLAVEGNRIRLSRKAILKEQRAKMAASVAERLLQCRLLERANNRFRRAAWSLRVAAIFRMIRKSRTSIAKAQRELEEEIVHHAVVIVVVDAVAVRWWWWRGTSRRGGQWWGRSTRRGHGGHGGGGGHHSSPPN